MFMLNMGFKQFLEVKYKPDTVQQIRDEFDKQKFSVVWLDINGNIRVGWPERDDTSRSQFSRSQNNRVSLDPEKKKLTIQMIGDKIKPGHKKIIEFLKRNGIIDDMWEVKGGNDIGEYIGGTYSHFTDPDLPKNVSDLQRSDVLSPIINNITLYHGTTDIGWDKIKKAGALYPLFMGSNKEFGFESRFKHKYNKDHLYLATNPDKAWDYAKTMASDFNRKRHKEEWQYAQHSEAERWPIRPILLQIKIPDISKLRADDDVANERMRKIAEKLWDQKNPEEKQQIMANLSKKVGWEVKDPSSAKMLWRDTDEAFPIILSKLNPKIYKAWLSSMLRTDQVAYKGFIPLKFIKEVPSFPKK
jgi:hypothetical protein